MSKNNYITEKSSISVSRQYFEQAQELSALNRHKDALDKYLYSLLMNKENPDAYLGLAISYKNLQNYNKAIINLKKAEKFQPSNFTVQKELALCNIIIGNFQDGLKYLINSIKIEPNNVDLQMQLALVHEMIEEEDMALMIYQKIIEKNPDYIRAYIQKATLYMYLQDYLNSVKLFRKILQLNPEYYRACLAIAICYDKLGNSASALRYYKKYIKFSLNTDNNKEILQRISLMSNRQKKANYLKIV